jgi:uncharacterized membrane protein
MTFTKERLAHWFFEISVIAKGVDGILEIAGGILLLVISPQQLYRIARVLTQHELVDDRHDRISQYLLNSVQHLATGARTFAAMYLLWHGVVKVVLVAGLLLQRRLAYPIAIAAFVLFLVYQLYRYSHTHAPELLVLSALDVIVIVLTWIEYKRLWGAHAVA